MSATPAWDRAGSLPVPVDGSLARPELATLAVPALTAGSYAFVCTIHPNMTGTLTVE